MLLERGQDNSFDWEAYSPEMPQLPLKGIPVQAQARGKPLDTESSSLSAPIAYQRFTSSQVIGARDPAKSCSRTLPSMTRGQIPQEEQISRLYSNRDWGNPPAPSYNERHKDNHPWKKNLSIEQNKYTPSKHIEYQLATPTTTRDPRSRNM